MNKCVFDEINKCEILIKKECKNCSFYKDEIDRNKIEMDIFNYKIKMENNRRKMENNGRKIYTNNKRNS